MKHFLSILLLSLSIIAKAQTITELDKVSTSDTMRTGHAVIYGNFIQRLGFTSGGFAQDIRIQEVNTKEAFSFRVKPAYKTAKENIFCFFIKPGRYAVINYFYTVSKWYGGKTFIEPIVTGNNHHYTFTIEPNTVNYLGTWHFDTNKHRFTDDKAECDRKLAANIKRIRPDSAKVTLPSEGDL